MKAFKSNYHGIMVSLGTYSGVAHVMGISLTGIFAIAVKHMINVVHLFGVGGRQPGLGVREARVPRHT